VITVGVDLAADPKRTAVAMVEWTGRDARLLKVIPMASDSDIVGLAVQADKTGIDCPLGWPDDFVEFVNAHHKGRVPHTDVGPTIREPLRFRETDRRIAAAKLGRPLSVSSDMIGVCAMRAAGLLAAMAKEGVAVDRSGVTGGVVETYPAVAIRQWHLAQGDNPSQRRYKGVAQSAVLGAMVDELKRGLRQLKLGGHEAACRASDHAFDALICAMVARATLQNRGTEQNPRRLIQRARREGWIAVPTCRLEDLLAPPTFESSTDAR
jgi:predicted nuclease with RNAse H fold